jgi:glycolate oxidase FAD binding subunit
MAVSSSQNCRGFEMSADVNSPSPELGSASLFRDGVRGSFRKADPALQEMRERILAAQTKREALLIQGSGSKQFYGERLSARPGLNLLDVSSYRGIVSYEPTELVITAKCGTPIAEIEAALEEQRQMLAFEPPRFLPGVLRSMASETARGTIGGAIATGLSGPRRVSAGPAKDFVLGAALVDGQGEWLQFGGTVMKNVAGYDLSRLLCGSLGIFGVIAEVSLKVLPKPAADQSVSLPCSQSQAIDWLNEWGGQPLPIVASLWHEGVLSLKLSGAVAAVSRATESFVSKHGATIVAADVAASFWRAVRDQEHGFFAGAHASNGGQNKGGPRLNGDSPARADGNRLWRLSLPSTAAELQLTGETMLEWGAALRWVWTSVSASEVRDKASALGGTAMLYSGEFDEREGKENKFRADVSQASSAQSGSAAHSRFHPLPSAILKIHQRLKAELDPHGVFNPSKMYPGL